MAHISQTSEQAFQQAFGLDLGVPALDGYQHEQPDADLGDGRVPGLDARLGYALQEAYHRLAPTIRRRGYPTVLIVASPLAIARSGPHGAPPSERSLLQASQAEPQQGLVNNTAKARRGTIRSEA